ncbi:MAG: phosphoribosyltransferase family protein [Bacteroidota bacterium]
MISFLKNLIHIFFPELCIICEKSLFEGESPICVHCRHDLPLTNFSFENNNTVETSFYGRVDIQEATALFYFYKKSNVQKLIQELKYRNNEEIGKYFGNWLGDDLLQSDRFKKIDCIIPVPLHPKKLKQRGYNQLTKFGESLSKKLQIPYIDDLLIRKTYAKTQTFKQREERIQDIEGIFDITDIERIRNKHVLLIDDVITTGSTIEACSLALTQTPSVKISIATMAYTP